MTVEPPARRVEEATDAFDQLTALLERFEPLETVLSRLVDSAATVIPDTASATVTILRAGQARTAAASHLWAAELDEHQYSALDGPCLEAARTGRLVRLQISEADRWPEYCRAARVQQVAVSVGAPLLIDEDIADTWGALNLTTPRPEAFDPLDEALLERVHPRPVDSYQPRLSPSARTPDHGPGRPSSRPSRHDRAGKRTSDGPPPLFRGGSVPTSSGSFPTRQHQTP